MEICQSQAACEKGLSSLNTSFLVHETINHRVQQGLAIFVTFLDQKKAFDSLWLDGLFYMLYKKGIRGKLWRVLRAAYTETYTAVLVNGLVSDYIRLYQGVKQGAINSMLMYISFVNGLLLEVKKSNLGTITLDIETDNAGYADDLTMLANFPQNMQSMYDIVTRYSRKWRIEFGFDKCANIVFNSKVKPNFILCDNVIRNVNEYVHVGVPVHNTKTVSNSFINSKIDACRRKFYSLIGCSLYKTTLSPCALKKVYLAVVIPRRLHGSEIRSYT